MRFLHHHKEVSQRPRWHFCLPSKNVVKEKEGTRIWKNNQARSFHCLWRKKPNTSIHLEPKKQQTWPSPSFLFPQFLKNQTKNKARNPKKAKSQRIIKNERNKGYSIVLVLVQHTFLSEKKEYNAEQAILHDSWNTEKERERTKKLTEKVKQLWVVFVFLWRRASDLIETKKERDTQRQTEKWNNNNYSSNNFFYLIFFNCWKGFFCYFSSCS